LECARFLTPGVKPPRQECKPKSFLEGWADSLSRERHFSGARRRLFGNLGIVAGALERRLIAGDDHHPYGFDRP
jgi:hypothetical protein